MIQHCTMISCCFSICCTDALNSTATEQAQWVADFNHFVIFDAQNLLACHDFQLIDLWPVCTTLQLASRSASVGQNLPEKTWDRRLAS